MTDLSSLDRLLERFPRNTLGTSDGEFIQGYHELRSALVALREELDERLKWEGAHPDHAEQQCRRLEAEVDRLDGIRGQLHDDLDAMGRMVNEARRVAEHQREELGQLQRDLGATETLRERLPWELRAPAA